MNNRNSKELSVIMKKLREDRKWTKTDVAIKLGKTLSTYANWEYGLREPDTETLTNIAELYGVSVDYLLGRTKNPNTVEREEEEKRFIESVGEYELKRWIIDLYKSSEEDLEKLHAMWKIIKGEKN